MIKVAPSVLSADFGNLQRDVEDICNSGCDLVHVDVMDGHFVPNHTIGPVVVSAIAAAATKPLDIHLMVENNSFFVDLFAPFKPEYISFHIEEEKHPHRLIQKIRSLGIKPAIVLNPHTPPSTCIRQSGFILFLISLSFAALGITVSMKLCPPKPGFTLIRRTISKS